MSTSLPSTTLPNPSSTRQTPLPLSRHHRRNPESTASVVVSTAQFLTTLVGTDVLASMPANRAFLSDLLDLEVTEHGYRLLVAPMIGSARPTADELAEHAGWWFGLLP